ncbi:MAG: hypothetical protein M0Q92_15990 [Methanoregula sp.]|nr:hypothetical protein [Methanoregula sp.]
MTIRKDFTDKPGIFCLSSWYSADLKAGELPVDVIIVASIPAAVTGEWGTKFSSFTNGSMTGL